MIAGEAYSKQAERESSLMSALWRGPLFPLPALQCTVCCFDAGSVVEVLLSFHGARSGLL